MSKPNTNTPSREFYIGWDEMGDTGVFETEEQALNAPWVVEGSVAKFREVPSESAPEASALPSTQESTNQDSDFPLLAYRAWENDRLASQVETFPGDAARWAWSEAAAEKMKMQKDLMLLRAVLSRITRVSGKLAVADCRKWAEEALAIQTYKAPKS
jgi:hypothetical protein